jgi:hypothetical protein
MRQDNVHQSHPAAETFQGTLATTDGACDSKGPWTVASGERAESVAVTVSADLPANDVVIELLRDGTVVAGADTLSSPR